MKNNKVLVYITGPVLAIGMIWATAMTSGASFSILFSLIFGIVLFLGYSYLAVIQFIEVMRPKDGLTNLRLLIFGVLMVTIVTFLPSLAYQYLRLMGIESEFIRDIVNVTGRISQLSILVIMIAIFQYKVSEKDLK